ncbi:MAG: hypothetical protein IJY97_00585 [Clostridia bacterium]|nr:hypothetical protein [Clostridia bacterium]
MNAEIRFKDKRILEALEYIDEKYIDDVFDVLKEPDMTQNVRVKLSPFRHWKQYLALAACLILLAFATPIFGYVAEFIGSFASGIGEHTSSITEDSDLGEVTHNDIESTENEQTTEKAIPNFQYSNVKITTDNNTSINPVSVHIGYSWYKDEKLVWTEEIASGWQYIIGNDKYKYENFPHLTICDFISHKTPENISLSSFMVYNTDWEKTVYSFDNIFDLRTLPAGDYIIVGIENERIPFDKPHYVVGEYDYKLDKSAVIFAITVTERIVAINDLEYLKFTTDLEEIDYDTMLEVKNAWAGFKSTGYSDFTYAQLFNSKHFFHYGYLGRIGKAVVIATFTEKQREPISMEIVYDRIIEIYIYTDGSIISLEEAYKKGILTYDDTVKFYNRSEEYDNFKFWYAIITPEW